jgi:hypothetical protein
MSNMLEQAIIDANNLREAALKNAEAAIIEKYQGEVKEAIETLLEQDEDAPAEEEVEVTTTTMEQVPMAHLPGDDEDVVVVDLDDIIAAAEEEPEEEEVQLDREEVADTVGLDLDLDADEAPANRDDDEVEIDETELVSMFKEILTIQVPEERLKDADEEDYDEEDLPYEDIQTVRVDGMDKEDIEDYERVMLRNESLEKQVTTLKKVLNTAKNKLQEVNLQNARLLYANRVLKDNSLNEQQKHRIAEMVSEADSVDEAKTVYETLQKTMAQTASRRSPQSLSEAISRKSNLVLAANRQDEKSNTSDPTYSRWATLAGMNNK